MQTPRHEPHRPAHASLPASHEAAAQRRLASARRSASPLGLSMTLGALSLRASQECGACAGFFSAAPAQSARQCADRCPSPLPQTPHQLRGHPQTLQRSQSPPPTALARPSPRRPRLGRSRSRSPPVQAPQNDRHAAARQAAAADRAGGSAQSSHLHETAA